MNFKFSKELPEFLASPNIEGVVLHPYLDSVKIPTIGIGTIVYPNGKKVTMSDPNITLDQAYDFCLDHLNKIVLPVLNKLIIVPLNQNQINALGSLIYNIGTGAFLTSSVLKSINTKESLGNIEINWKKWNKAGGKELAGLVNRRIKEFKLYNS